MINNKFKDTFNFLASFLNDLNKFTKNQSESSGSIEKMIESIKAIYSKQSTITLENLRDELISVKKEIRLVHDKISDPIKMSLIFAINSLVDSLIVEVDTAIDNSKKMTPPPKSKNNNVKVKIFKSTFASDVEKEMNLFLDKNPNIEIINTLQNIDNGIVCITIFYK